MSRARYGGNTRYGWMDSRFLAKCWWRQRAQSLYGSDPNVREGIFTFCSPLYRIQQGNSMIQTNSSTKRELISYLPPPITAGNYILVTHTLNEWSGWVVCIEQTKQLVGEDHNANTLQKDLKRLRRSRTFSTPPLPTSSGQVWHLSKVSVLHCPQAATIQEYPSMWKQGKCYFL